ncbi:MAG: hypothetical protein L0Z49_02645 [Actinobacteria bacterium]|nr:hypothetical protein [Actinomycetota bacterium]
MDVRTATTPDTVAHHPDGGVILTAGGEDLEASHLLIATGRTPKTDRLRPDTAGIAADERVTATSAAAMS